MSDNLVEVREADCKFWPEFKLSHPPEIVARAFYYQVSMIFLAALVLAVSYWNEDLKVHMFAGRFLEIYGWVGITITTVFSIVAIDFSFYDKGPSSLPFFTKPTTLNTTNKSNQFKTHREYSGFRILTMIYN